MTAVSSPVTKSADPIAGYMGVQLEMLRRLHNSPVDLYIQYEANSQPALYYRAGCPLEDGQVSRLLATGVRQILVRADEFHRFASHLLETVDARAECEPVPPAERFAALQLAMA